MGRRSRSRSRGRSRSRSHSRSRGRRRRSRSYSSGSDMDGFRVHVGDLGIDCSRREIEKVYEKFGPLHEVWLARNPPCFAFIVYRHKEDAEQAIENTNGKVVCGYRVKVNYALPRTRGRRLRSSDNNMRCYSCGERGHFSRECDVLWKNQTYCAGFRARSRSFSRSRSRSPDRKRRRSRSRDRRSRSRGRKSKGRMSRSRDRRGSKDRRSRSKEKDKRNKRSRSKEKSQRKSSRSRSRSREREASVPKDMKDDREGLRSPVEQSDPRKDVPPQPIEDKEKASYPDEHTVEEMLYSEAIMPQTKE